MKTEKKGPWTAEKLSQRLKGLRSYLLKESKRKDEDHFRRPLNAFVWDIHISLLESSKILHILDLPSVFWAAHPAAVKTIDINREIQEHKIKIILI